MKVDASVGRAPKSVDLRDSVGSIKFTAEYDTDRKLLARMYRIMADGGMEALAEALGDDDG